jgi:hypothetical protein
MPISILHVGLPLDHPAIPVEERPKIAKRLGDLTERMRRAGYSYEVVSIDPDGGIEELRALLKARSCDGVLIGGGVAGDPAMSYFREQIVNATHEVAPKAKIMFYSHSTDVREIVARWFPSPAADNA